MSPGRCPGCGYTDTSCKKVTRHMVGCTKLAEKYRADPSSVLSAEAEYVRWKAEEDNPEVRADAKSARLGKRFAETDKRRLEQTERFRTPDILS
jgi:hypothetical protein